MAGRATHGAMEIESIVCDFQNDTVLVTSHGIARIEPMIQVIRGEGDIPPTRFLNNGEMVELIFNDRAKLIEEIWHDPIAPASVSAA